MDRRNIIKGAAVAALGVAVPAAAGLSDVEKARILHKGLTPENFEEPTYTIDRTINVVNLETKEVNYVYLHKLEWKNGQVYVSADYQTTKRGRFSWANFANLREEDLYRRGLDMIQVSVPENYILHNTVSQAGVVVKDPNLVVITPDTRYLSDNQDDIQREITKVLNSQYDKNKLAA